MSSKNNLALLFILCIAVLIPSSVSGFLLDSGNRTQDGSIDNFTSYIESEAIESAGPGPISLTWTDSIVGTWNACDASHPTMCNYITFRADHTWSHAGRSGTWVVVDAINGIYRFELNGYWRVKVSSNCLSFIATNSQQGRTVNGKRVSGGGCRIPVKIAFSQDTSSGDKILTWTVTNIGAQSVLVRPYVRFSICQNARNCKFFGPYAAVTTSVDAFATKEIHRTLKPGTGGQNTWCGTVNAFIWNAIVDGKLYSGSGNIVIIPAPWYACR